MSLQYFNSTFNVAKCNLGKVNLELMLPAVSSSLHMIRGGAPLEFAGANYVQPCLLAIVAITASVSESLDNLIFLLSFVFLLSPKQSRCFTSFYLQITGDV